jgi:Family of unknown function (DUF5706)
MATTEQREALNNALSATLSRTIDFLKFSETKNAALLTFASAWLVALINLLSNHRIANYGPRTAIIISLFLFALAAVVALYSFLPKLKLSAFHRDPDRQKSLLYFGDVSEFDAATYAVRFSERYTSEIDEVISDDYLHDLAVQVAANSSITMRKFNLFNVGGALVMTAIIVLAAATAWATYHNLWTS